MGFQDFIYTYFLQPIEVGSGYNVVNTTAYALILVLLAYGTFEVLRRFKIKIDRKFVTAVVPFILFAISIRIFEDAGIVSGFWFVTPGIWVLFLGVILSALLLSVLVQKKTKFPYYKIMGGTGLALFLPTLLFMQLKNVQGIFYVLLFFSPILLGLKLIKWSIENKAIVAAHGFDAVVTFVSIDFFGYRELHVLPNFVIGLTGSAFSFIVLKLLVIIPVLILLDRYTDDKEFKNYIKFIIAVLGFVPGTRDFLRLIFLV